MTLTGEFVDRNGDAVATVGDIVAFNLTVVNDGKVWEISLASRDA